MTWKSLPTGMVLDLPMNWLSPRKTIIPDKVTMKAGIPT